MQAVDVLEVLEARMPRRPDPPLPAMRRVSTSASSIAPVGLDLAPNRPMDEEINPTMEIRLPLPRRRLGGVVVATVASCTLILVAAALARVGHADYEPSTGTAAVAPQPTAPRAAAPTPVPAPLPPTPAPALTAVATDTPSTGTIRIARPSAVCQVLLDWRKITASSAIVSCGTHQIRLGSARPHSIDVPLRRRNRRHPLGPHHFGNRRIGGA